jgi:tetratricopeptide (TPR) repeat protein
MSSAARQKAILPWWQLAVLLAACGAGVWLLLPDDTKLISDFLRDGKPHEARRLLLKLTPAQRAHDIDRIRFLEIRTSRLEIPPADPATLDRFWREAVSAWRETDFYGPIFLEFTPLIPRLSDPAAAWSVIAPAIARAPTAQRSRLIEDFTRLALSNNQPALAAEIFALGHPATARPPEAALELSRLWQLAGRPTDALAALGENSSDLLTTRRTTLLRELNRNREALALLRVRAETTVLDAALTEELAAVALAAGEPITAAPYVQRYLDANPRDLPAQRRLRDLLLASGHTVDALPPARQAVALGPRNPEDLRALARIYEYTGQPSEAFTLWLELTLVDNPAITTADRLAGLDRLIALNPGLYRDSDLARALAKLVPIPGHIEYTLRLARLQVSLGLYDEARSTYENYLLINPDAADVLVEFAHLQNDLYHFANAEKLLRRALVFRPDDLTIRSEIAEILIAQGRPADALALYRELAKISDTEEIIGPYVRLAESLGRYDDFTRGLRRRIDRTPTPSARDFILLAYGYELVDDDGRRQAALAEGLRRAGQSDELRLLLALALSAEKKYADAQAALAPHASLHSDATAAALYLELLRLNNDTAGARRYLAEPLAEPLVHDETILERVARARESLHDYVAAEKIWRELLSLRPTQFDYAASLARVLLLRGHTGEANRLLTPFLDNPTPAILQLAAEISESAGDHRAAESYQLAYIKAVPTASARDWGALGDIRLSRGDRTGAKRAYAQALLRLHAQLAAKGAAP